MSKLKDLQIELKEAEDNGEDLENSLLDQINASKKLQNAPKDFLNFINRE